MTAPVRTLYVRGPFRKSTGNSCVQNAIYPNFMSIRFCRTRQHQISLVFVPRIETVLAIMNHYCTKHITVSHIFLHELVPGTSPCQHINMFVHTKDILRVSACQNASIMTCSINFRHYVTPISLMSNVPDTTGHNILSYEFVYLSHTYLCYCFPVCLSFTYMITLILIQSPKIDNHRCNPQS